MKERAEFPLEEPQAKLERALMEEFLQARGLTLSTVDRRPPDERRALLTQAALHAAIRLSEIDARAAYVHDLHGVPR